LEINCTQCGAPVQIREGEGFLRCGYCDSSLYVDLDSLCLHFYIKPMIGKEKLPGILGRWLQSMEVKGDPALRKTRYLFFPFWSVSGKGMTSLLLAAPTPFPELELLQVAPGDYVFYDSSIEREAEAVPPQLTGEVALKKFQGKGGDPEGARLQLLHVPLYEIEYEYGGERFSAVVDAIRGAVHAHRSPSPSTSRLDRSHTVAFSVTVAVFLLEGLLIPGFWPTLIAYIATGVGMRFLFKRYVIGKLKW
jgi:hypothetical protein